MGVSATSFGLGDFEFVCCVVARLVRLTTAPLGLPCLSHSEISPCSSSFANLSASNLLATAGNTRLSILPVCVYSPVVSSLNINGAFDDAHGGSGPSSSPAARKSSGLPADMLRCLGFVRPAAEPFAPSRAEGEGESVVLLRAMLLLAGEAPLRAGLDESGLVDLSRSDGDGRFWIDDGLPVWAQFCVLAR